MFLINLNIILRTYIKFYMSESSRMQPITYRSKRNMYQNRLMYIKIENND